MAKEEEVTVRLGTGTSLACAVCRHDRFIEHAVQMNLSASPVGGVLRNRAAKIRVCARCRFVHWFYGREHHLEPEPIDP